MSTFFLVLLWWHEEEAGTDRWRDGNDYRNSALLLICHDVLAFQVLASNTIIS